MLAPLCPCVLYKELNLICLGLTYFFGLLTGPQPLCIFFSGDVVAVLFDGQDRIVNPVVEIVCYWLI